MDYINIPYQKPIPVLMAETDNEEEEEDDKDKKQSRPLQFVSIHTNKPRQFDGKNPKEWVEYFDIICTANGWKTAKKLQIIPTLFHDHPKARSWYKVNYKGLLPKDYKEFTKLLIESLQPSDDNFKKYIKMNQRTQELNESGIEYFYAKMELINECNPETDEKLKVNMIIDGLLPDIKAKMINKYKTITEVQEAIKHI